MAEQKDGAQGAQTDEGDRDLCTAFLSSRRPARRWQGHSVRVAQLPDSGSFPHSHAESVSTQPQTGFKRPPNASYLKGQGGERGSGEQGSGQGPRPGQEDSAWRVGEEGKHFGEREPGLSEGGGQLAGKLITLCSKGPSESLGCVLTPSMPGGAAVVWTHMARTPLPTHTVPLPPGVSPAVGVDRDPSLGQSQKPQITPANSVTPFAGSCLRSGRGISRWFKTTAGKKLGG